MEKNNKNARKPHKLICSRKEKITRDKKNCVCVCERERERERERREGVSGKGN
ncbi:hypothetical protein HanRHA438_Chr11g0512481 [Helianthus annuus]|uniref:Uncharacterized protein n=1 Tax=Helianthus annuus TaxID=4232 RepID=A0A251T9N5_HELAN|nr:hypothetical protein HanHA300_Chr11g0410161 [Helianthus annuus]KAJ0518135.1 hypothetical protein HanHA89_Chr11g0433901 [Helianthus annuus]KAJ0686160.1 hypothetical protein HanLR1_Chr11g0411491 [Helianthus annuus]KAJ0690000.1 hypothetical protein HanOQP8_Chr11g0412781 [Helianthus annuus]KAJ0871449.1 hypothetical protein HanRHA438_Chr11g0512481 [Helianthus annuus]